MDDMTAAGQPARRSTTAREAVFFLPDAAADAVLALEDGRVFRGHSVGAPGRATGEVVFTTGMTGYQEVLTDPSYAGQIVTFTYPLIGNVGVNPVDAEAPVPRCQGVILRRLSRRASNHRATGTLQQWLHREGLVAVAGIDTRALTRHIRSAGALRGVLEASDAAPGEEAHTALDLARLVEEARALPSMQGRDLTGAAACGGLARCTGTGAARRLESLEPDGAGDPFAGGE
ncbi:MAG: carbamoyl-phosphate synthase domain-containing protein, partial [Candidatus Eiseniibacteriota bacterium]